MALARRLQAEEDRNGGLGSLFMFAPRRRVINAQAAASSNANGSQPDAASNEQDSDARRRQQQQSLEQFQQLFEVYVFIS